MITANIQLKGTRVLLAGAPAGAARVHARLVAAGAVVQTLEAPGSAATLQPGLGLFVLCDEVPERFSGQLAACRAAGVPVMSETPASAGGKITLVGGGPGAFDLLTLRAIQALADADEVYFDRLGPVEHLAELAPAARMIDVGKAPGHHKVTQRTIEKLMIESAAAGNHVVRFKGGDPYVFGRGYEELVAARKAGVPITVVPGLSSSITVPAAAGIPVTARGVTRAFTVISGHDPFGERELEHLSALGGTIVVLMGMGTLDENCAGLLRHGMSAQTPCAIVENGSTDAQRTTSSTLGSLSLDSRAAGCANPAVIVIGDVAGLPYAAVDPVASETREVA